MYAHRFPPCRSTATPPSRPASWSLIVIGLVTLSLMGGCPAPDPCENGDPASVLIGDGVGGAFEEYAPEQQVDLSVAPQGGFGVSVVLQTSGLKASDDTRVDVRLVTEIDGENTGEFLLEGAPLLCRSDGEGGSLSGLVVGFDRDIYRTNDDLLELNGQVVDLVVTLIGDALDTDVESRKLVTVVIGG